LPLLSGGVQTNSWQVEADGTASYLGSENREVICQENAFTLIGHIPDITSDSRLVLEAYDFLHGSEQVACHVSLDGR